MKACKVDLDPPRVCKWNTQVQIRYSVFNLCPKNVKISSLMKITESKQSLNRTSEASPKAGELKTGLLGKKCPFWGFPGGAVVENLPANAGDTGSSPGLGRSHVPRSNSAREPQLLSLRVWSLCSATREVTIVRGPRTVMKSDPCSPQLEKALAQKRRPNTAINKW